MTYFCEMCGVFDVDNLAPFFAFVWRLFLVAYPKTYSLSGEGVHCASNCMFF